ncbi:MAG: orotidine-5'-phosphate decarboxylase [Bdellovibrionota bacterium]
MSDLAKAGERLILALDTPELPEAREFIHSTQHLGIRYKVGPELFLAAGPEWLDKVIRQGARVFLDLKFHDIPNTVEQACRRAAGWGVWMCNVHALGGAEMIRRARAGLEEAADPRRGGRPLLLAVTLLTSHDEKALSEIGLAPGTEGHVVRLAKMAKSAGADGVVCSALEAAAVRKELGPDFTIVTPGIRPAGADVNDQVRISTPAGAIKAGASHLVVGRPITKAEKPAVACRVILTEMAGALG